MRAKKKKASKDRTFGGKYVFKLKEVGAAIEELLGNLYSHRFSQKPINEISTPATSKLLDETVSVHNQTKTKNKKS